VGGFRLIDPCMPVHHIMLWRHFLVLLPFSSCTAPCTRLVTIRLVFPAVRPPLPHTHTPHPLSEEKDLRITKLPAGVTSVMVEAGPNPANDNSAVWVNYQVRRQQPAADLLPPRSLPCTLSLCSVP
jgi:hypothetical protein